MSGPEKIWATMMDPEFARSGTFVDCEKYPQKPNADADQYTRTDLIPNPHDVARAALEKAKAAASATCEEEWEFLLSRKIIDAIDAIMENDAALAEIVKGVKG
jgi:hypothetical protein